MKWPNSFPARVTANNTAPRRHAHDSPTDAVVDKRSPDPDPGPNGNHPYPNGYVSYSSVGCQAVNPFAGQAIPKSDPLWQWGVELVRIDEAVFFPVEKLVFPEGEPDALTEPGALDEAGLVRCSFDAINSRVVLLFDCRGALQIRRGDVALIVVDGVTELSWTSNNTLDRVWHVVSVWRPLFDGLGYSLQCRLGYISDADLHVKGSSARFIVGRTSLDELAPPDLTPASDGEVRRGFPDWDTLFELLYGSTIG